VQSPRRCCKDTTPPPRRRWGRKKIACHRNGGRTHNAAVAQASVAGFRRYPIAAVCPHARNGGHAAAIAVAEFFSPTTAAAAVGKKKIARIGLCTPGVDDNTRKVPWEHP
jgi:hypothetical protein